MLPRSGTTIVITNNGSSSTRFIRSANQSAYAAKKPTNLSFPESKADRVA